MSLAEPVIRRQRLADQVYDVLRGRILARELAPGDHLSVPGIAAELGLSRSPVREAVQRLVVEGLGVEEMHRGARVAGAEAGELVEVYAVREALEGLAAASAAARGDRTALVADLKDHLATHQRALEAGDEAAILAADLDFHRAVVAASDNDLLARMLEPLLGRSQVAMLAGDLRRWPRRAVTEHRRILTAVRAGDPVAAETAAREHVRAVLDRHLARLGG